MRLKIYDIIYVKNFRRNCILLIKKIKIKPIRGSSYLPTPEKYSNPKCENNCIEKIKDKYNYDNMNSPANYDNTKTFEENNKVRVMVYITNKTKYHNKNEEEREDLEIIRDFVGNPDYYENDNINLLRTSDDDDNSHYIYSKKNSHSLNLVTKEKIHNISALIAINVLIVLLFQIIKNYKIQFNEGSLMKLPEHQKTTY